MSAYTEADVDRLAQVIDNAREAGIHHGNYTLARWILDRWPVEETGRRWVFPLDSKADVVMPNGVHVYWSTHCRHGNHADCKGSCKICGSPCLCASCTHQPVEGSTPLASPAPARPRGLDSLLGYVADRLDATPAGEVVSVPPPGKIDSREALTGRAVGYAKEYGHWRLEADAAIRKLDADAADSHIGCAGDALDSLRRKLDELYELGAASHPADEPAPVPPPVDALLVLVDEHACWEAERAEWHQALMADERSGVPSKIPTYRVDRAEKAAALCRGRIAETLRALWAAGVEEGRRQRAAQVEELQVLLDHAEQYARDLQDNGNAEAERDEEWGLRYKVDGLQREAGDGGHVFSSRDEAERHITTWRQHYPGLTYTDVEYMSREVLTNPWVPRG